MQKRKNQKGYSEIKIDSVVLMSKFDGKIKSFDRVEFNDNPPILFGPKSTVRSLDVTISSTECEDKSLLQRLLQKTRRG